MIPVEQTDITEETGNCFPSCIASILELPLEKVPCYHAPEWSDAVAQYNAWLQPYGLTLVTMSLPEGIEHESAEFRARLLPGYSILAAESPRFDCLHAVVCHNGDIAHDPHPQREMGVGKWVEVDFLVPLDPSVILKKHAHTPR